MGRHFAGWVRDGRVLAMRAPTGWVVPRTGVCGWLWARNACPYGWFVGRTGVCGWSWARDARPYGWFVGRTGVCEWLRTRDARPYGWFVARTGRLWEIADARCAALRLACGPNRAVAGGRGRVIRAPTVGLWPERGVCEWLRTRDARPYGWLVARTGRLRVVAGARCAALQVGVVPQTRRLRVVADAQCAPLRCAVVAMNLPCVLLFSNFYFLAPRLTALPSWYIVVAND